MSQARDTKRSAHQSNRGGGQPEMADGLKPDEALQQSARELQQVTDALPALVAYVDPSQRYRFASAAYERWFGRPRADVLGRHLREVLGDDAYRAIQVPVERALSGVPVTFEADIPYRDGGRRSIEASYVPQFGDEGAVHGFVSLVADVSDRKQFERFRAAAAARAERLLTITAALADAVTSDQVLQAMVDRVAEVIGASSAGLWLVDEAGTSARLVRALGYSEEALQAFASLPLGDSEGPRAPVVDAIGRAELIWASSQEELLAQYPQLRGDLEPGRWQRLACLPLVAQRRVLGTLALTLGEASDAPGDERDFLMLIARYASQGALRIRLFEAERRSQAQASEARVRAEQLYRFAQSVVAPDRVEQVFEAALGAIEGALGARRAAILIADAAGVMPFRAHHNLSEAYRSAVEGHSPWPADAVAPEPVLVPDITRDAALATFLPLFAREGIGSLAFIPLVTHGRLLGKFMVYYEAPHSYAAHELETALAIANHVASVISRFNAVAELRETIRSNELFAGVLAHDLRNPLGAIMTAAQLILMRHGSEDAAEHSEKRLTRILTSGQRMTRMIDQLLDFTRARSGGGIEIQPREINLADLCAQASGELELAHPEWTIERRSVGDLGGTWDSDRLLQVISNLVANAGEHGHKGGRIAIDLDGRRPEAVRVAVHNQGAVPGGSLTQLFDPFRSMRHPRDRSRGLGLGLFIVRELVRAHGGSVEVHSSESEGTTFQVELPRHARPPGTPPAPAPGAP